MAVIDDVKSLAAMDVVYLSRTFRADMQMENASTEVYRGRLRQALSGDWVFNASDGQNGVLGFILGGIDGTWTSNETPAGGIQVNSTRTMFSIQSGPMPPQNVNEVLGLSSVIPVDFAD